MVFSQWSGLVEWGLGELWGGVWGYVRGTKQPLGGKGFPQALRDAGSLFLLICRNSFVFLSFPMIVPCLSWLSPLLALLFISVSSCFVDSCSVFFFIVPHLLSFSHCLSLYLFLFLSSYRKLLRATPNLGCSSVLLLPASGIQLQLGRVLGGHLLLQRAGVCLRVEMRLLEQKS